MAKIWCKVLSDPTEGEINKVLADEDILFIKVVSAGRDHVVMMYIFIKDGEK